MTTCGLILRKCPAILAEASDGFAASRVPSSESQFLCRGAQFSLARPPDDCGPGRFTIVEETATLAARGRHQIRLNTLAGILRQRSTGPQRLIVGMSEHT